MSRNTFVLILKIFFLIVFSFGLSISENTDKVSLKEECIKNLIILTNDLFNLQNHDSSNSNYGALYCAACSEYHTRASESVLPLAVAFKETNDQKYLLSAISTGNWLITQQQTDGSWLETPDTWKGTTTDQVLSISTAYSILKNELTEKELTKWNLSIKKAADWLVQNMNLEFASINYCATTTAALMIVYREIPDSTYLKKAKELSLSILPKFDEDYFLTGEGNRVRGNKYGIDPGYNMDMSLWGLGLYAKLANDNKVNDYVKESLKRHIYFIYPDGSTDGSWGVRASKWTTYGSFTADGCQILFGIYAKDNPVYRNAALANLNYLMKIREKGLLTYGPHYYEMFKNPPCIYPTFCRAKNLALTVIYGDQEKGDSAALPSQKPGWIKHFKTLDIALVRTKNFMATISGYHYKDIRRGADFKYMFRPSGGSITNLWCKNFGYVQASSQTEYKKWEMNYPEIDTSLPLTPRIQFRDSIFYYTNLFDFDSQIFINEENGFFNVVASGELKDRNRWEGGVAYILTQKFTNNFVEKNIKLRFHSKKYVVEIIEPLIKNKNRKIRKLNDYTVELSDENQSIIFELLTRGYPVEMGIEEEKYKQPFPSLKGYPVIIKVIPDKNSFVKEISYRISVKKI